MHVAKESDIFNIRNEVKTVPCVTGEVSLLMECLQTQLKMLTAGINNISFYHFRTITIQNKQQQQQHQQCKTFQPPT